MHTISAVNFIFSTVRRALGTRLPFVARERRRVNGRKHFIEFNLHKRRFFFLSLSLTIHSRVACDSAVFVSKASNAESDTHYNIVKQYIPISSRRHKLDLSVRFHRTNKKRTPVF